MKISQNLVFVNPFVFSFWLIAQPSIRAARYKPQLLSSNSPSCLTHINESTNPTDIRWGFAVCIDSVTNSLGVMASFEPIQDGFCMWRTC